MPVVGGLRRSGSGVASATVLSPAYQIEEREQEDPDQVDEVPVERAQLDGDVVLRGVLAFDDALHHPEQHRHPDDDVERVQAGGQEVDREVHVRAGVLHQLLGVEPLAGQLSDLELVRILEVLDGEEDERTIVTPDPDRDFFADLTPSRPARPSSCW